MRLRQATREEKGVLRRPFVPEYCGHNAHMYYILLSPEFERQPVLDALKESGVYSVFHYVPLHSSPAGQRYGRTHGDLVHTDRQSERLIRLPLWIGLTPAQQERIVETLAKACRV